MKDETKRGLVVFAVTSVSAFWVNAVGNVYLIWRKSPLVRDYKATLQYRSALAGDAVLLPLLSVALDRQLDAWGDGPRPGQVRRRRLARSLIGATSITAAFHVYQATQKLTNWTMPRPWRWNVLGYYHALYMAGQATQVCYFAGSAIAQVRAHGVRALLTPRLVAAMGLLLGWAGLLYKDYY